MSTTSLAAFAGRLRERGVIGADAPDPPEEMHDRPWFIALLQGVAGWLAGLLLLIFIGVVADPERTFAFVTARDRLPGMESTPST